MKAPAFMKLKLPLSLRWIVLALLIILVALVATRSLATRPDATAPLFDDAKLHEIRLRMNAKDLATLIEQFGENTYYRADFVFDDAIIRNVGVRSRGSGSRNPIKLGLKVDFNRFA